MAVVGTDLLLIERGGVLYQATAAQIAALGGGGGSVALTQITLTVSPVATSYAEVVHADPAVSPASKIIASLVGELDAENDLEELSDSQMRIFAIAESAQIRFVFTGLGSFAGPFKINYEVRT